MRSIIDTYKKTGELHHAYVIEGEVELLRPELFHFIEHEMGESVRGNPDFWHGRFETLSIDDARMLRERQANKSFSNSVPTGDTSGRVGRTTGRKIFVIETRFMTHEAQNALLKIFEEPTAGTHFFIITPSAEIFLPTLRSRLNVIKRNTRISSESNSESTRESNSQAMVKEFLTASVSERISLCSEMIEEKEKGKAIDFVEALIAAVRAKKSPAENSALFAELLQCRDYLSDRSPSLKLIVEHIALIVPVLA